MIGAPFMTLLLSSAPRRKALILLMAIFTIGNILAVFAPNYVSLMGARIITSLNHGAYFGIGSVVAASLVPKEKQAGAVAMMFMGLTIANIGGIPLATWFSQNFGWCNAFAVISGQGVVMMLVFPILAITAIGAGIALVIWGATTFAVVPPLQIRVREVAHEAQGLVSSVNIGAFNFVNAVGAAAGGAVLSLNLGSVAVFITAAVLAGIAMLLVLWQMRRQSDTTTEAQVCTSN